MSRSKGNSALFSLKENSTVDSEDQNGNVDDGLMTKAWLQAEAISRLSNRDFWEEFKQYFKISGINEFGTHCYDVLEAYSKALEGEVERATRKALETKSTRQLRLIRNAIEDCRQINDQVRFSLKKQEGLIQGLLNGIDRILKDMGEKPQSVFYRPKQQDIVGGVWKEHTVCPKCNTIINRSEIFGDPEGYELNSETNEIMCICAHRFDWKKHRREPEAFVLRCCIACDQPFVPDKRNWRKQRVCKNCKAKGVDSFYLDHPDYQKKRYKDKKGRGKVA